MEGGGPVEYSALGDGCGEGRIGLGESGTSFRVVSCTTPLLRRDSGERFVETLDIFENSVV